MKKCYINGIGCVSAQKTFDNSFLDTVEINVTDTVLSAINPDYKAFISPGAIRRMAQGVKMGIAASHFALEDAGVQMPDAIITGTGMGCIQDSEKFLKAIINNQEQFLTPTSFIQSTHNTVGGQIALNMQCKGYNFTYVNGAVSLESALLDSKMQIESGEAATILSGGVDETSAHTISLYELIHLIKDKSEAPFDVLNPKSKGVVLSEGAGFFVLENKKTTNSYAVFADIQIYNQLSENELPGVISDFLKRNKLSIDTVDAIVLGNNGDTGFDHYYQKAGSLFSETPQLYYKHLSGEFYTASTSGFWAALQVLKQQHIPQVLQMNGLTKKHYKNILLYNQYRGKDHSLILLNHVDV